MHTARQRRGLRLAKCPGCRSALRVDFMPTVPRRGAQHKSRRLPAAASGC